MTDRTNPAPYRGRMGADEGRDEPAGAAPDAAAQAAPGGTGVAALRRAVLAVAVLEDVDLEALGLDPDALGIGPDDLPRRR